MYKSVVLAGNPNVGKSTLFNQLTGSRQKIANYPGVTVEKLQGRFTTPMGQDILLTDLPGTYSLNTKSEDEVIAVKYIQGHIKEASRPDVVVVMVEATKLRRGLLLVTQIQKIHPQTILVLNMMDELKATGTEIDLLKLSQKLKIPVIPLCAKKGEGIKELISEIENKKKLPRQEPISKNKAELFSVPEDCHGPQAWPWAEGVEEEFKVIDTLIKETVKKTVQRSIRKSDYLDKIFLHPFLGPLVFFAVMLLLFQALFTWSVPLMDFIEEGLGVLSGIVLSHIETPWLVSFISDGIIAGVGAVLVFVPLILIAFLFIGFLEMSGYLARGAFLIDRFMRLFGLEGRSFIPLISSFACAVQGIMSTRTIANERQRLITILMAPFMTCSARLPIYTLLIACFVPATSVFGFLNLQALTLFALFISGILAGLFMALIMNRILPKKGESVFFLELPRYRLPPLRAVYHYVLIRLKVFLKTAGTIIFIFSMILWGLAYFPRSTDTVKKYEEKRTLVSQSVLVASEKQLEIKRLEQLESSELLQNSFMGKMGKFIEPVITPLGFDWKIGIGVISSFAAREVFVSTMGIVYNLGPSDEESETLRRKLQTAVKEDGSPAYTLRTALALMVFFAFAAQCMSTLAIIGRETNSRKWPVFVFCYMTVFAYLLSLFVYQGLGFLGVG